MEDLAKTELINIIADALGTNKDSLRAYFLLRKDVLKEVENWARRHYGGVEFG